MTSRRQFLATAATLGFGAAGGAAGERLEALAEPARSESRGGLRTLHLEGRKTAWEIAPRKTIKALAYNGRGPGPEIRAREGERLRIVFKNSLREPTTIHWHGVDVPNKMDGVPGTSSRPGARSRGASGSAPSVTAAVSCCSSWPCADSERRGPPPTSRWRRSSALPAESCCWGRGSRYSYCWPPGSWPPGAGCSRASGTRTGIVTTATHTRTGTCVTTTTRTLTRDRRGRNPTFTRTRRAPRALARPHSGSGSPPRPRLSGGYGVRRGQAGRPGPP